MRYSLDDELKFTETIQLPKLSTINYQLSTIQPTLFALHLIGGTSYYKTCCPKNIEVRSGTLTKDQADFWNTVYTKGLAEFFYRNGIDSTDLIQFPYELDKPEQAENTKYEIRNTKYLVPIGGGKDSMVTAELLKDAEIDFDFFRLGSHPIIDDLVQAAGKDLVTAKRSLDPKLFELNEQGALNGHVPITAYISFLTVLLAQLHGYKGVIFSNERSANFGNITHNDVDVNHQWSKSKEFEDMLQDYLADEVGTNVQYFSLLRGMSELAISQLFLQHPEYVHTATSCNKNWRINNDDPKPRWCGECPKCAFVFCQFAAFTSAEKLTKMFGKNLFADESLLPLYRELLNLDGMKPFECVGTPEEMQAAFLLALAQEGWEDTPAMQLFLTESAPGIHNSQELIEEVLQLSDDHLIPADFLLQIQS